MENSSARNIKIGAVLTYLTQFLSIAISFIYVPIMLGKLGQSEYGLYSIVQSLIAYLQMSEMGIGTTATRYNSKYIGEDNKTGQQVINGMFLKMYLGIAAVCCLIATGVYFCLDMIYADYSFESLQLIKRLFIIAVINLAITFVFKIFDSIVIAYEEYIFLKVIKLIQTVIGPVGMLIALFMGFGSIGMLCVTTIISLLFGVTQMTFCLKKYKVRFKMSGHDMGLFKKILSFTVYVFINSLANQLMVNSDKVVISIVMTEYAVAVYAIVMQFHTYSYNFANVLSGFYLPRYTKIITKSKQITTELEADLVRTGRIQVLVAGLILGGFIAVGEEFIVLWVGTEYQTAYILTCIILLTEVIGASQSMFNSLMQAMNLHKVRAVLSVAVSIVKIMLTIIMTKCWGLFGCAFAFLIGWLIKQIVFNIYYRYRAGMHIGRFWLDMIKMYVPLSITIGGLFVAFSFVLKILPATSFPVIIGYILVYVVLYGIIMYYTALNAYEKSLVSLLLSKFRRKK